MTTNNLIDSNLTATVIFGTLMIDLSDVVAQLGSMVNYAASESNLSTVVSFRSLNLELTKFFLPVLDVKKFYDPDKFNRNFLQAFGSSFPTNASSRLLYGVNIRIVNNLPINMYDQLEPDELAAFRFLTCFLLGLAFNINVDGCACYPENLGELKATQANLGLNCVKLACKNQLKLNPLFYDELIHTDCTDTVVQAAFITLDVFAGKNVNVNVALNQSVTTSPPSLDYQPRVGAILPVAAYRSGGAVYLPCDGRHVSVSGFPDLFRAIGYTYRTQASSTQTHKRKRRGGNSQEMFPLPVIPSAIIRVA